MSSAYDRTCSELRREPRSWLITGVAGFIGSNILETLLGLGQTVVGLDSFATGYRKNLDEVRSIVGEEAWRRFRFIEGDIRDHGTCRESVADVEYILHQAALGSVPRSLEDPLTTNAVNVDGFVNMLDAAREAEVARFIYAGSSSTYGDHEGLPKVEDQIGNPLSPYAVTKYVNELYADVFSRSYGFKATGLRYFNVFGPRQDPEGAYAAVIPKWAAALLNDEVVFINGDGETSRDFCYVANAVQANILAACADESAQGEVYNVAVGERTSLNELLDGLQQALAACGIERKAEPVYRDFRPGDVRHSLADIGKAQERLGYAPTHTLPEGLVEAMPWYVALLAR